jgi:uridine kinase
MDLSVEVKFINELYKKYASLKKVLIPKDEYYKTIEVASSESKSKFHHQYNLSK